MSLEVLKGGHYKALQVADKLEVARDLLWGHIHRAETAYFPRAEERLSPRHLREVDDEMGVIGWLEEV